LTNPFYKLQIFYSHLNFGNKEIEIEMSDDLMGDSSDGVVDSPFSKLPGGEGGWLHQIILFAAK